MRTILAPLADFTDAPFRKLCFEGGASKVYTEMVSAAALAHGHNATRVLLEVLPGEGPVGCQLFGADEGEMARAVRVATERPGPRFCEINLNAGCPMPKVTRCGAGAKLAESPERVYALLKVMKENTDLPVTLKTRLGPHPQRTTVLELLDAAERAGAAEIIIHARYASQMHGGETHLDRLAEAVRCAHIPIVGNGSVKDADSAAAMAATGVDGVMVGRAALANPDVFAALSSGGPDIRPPDGQTLFVRHIGYLIDFHRQLTANLPDCRLPSLDAFVALKARTHLFRYFSGQPGAAALRARFNAVRSLADVYSLLKTAAPR